MILTDELVILRAIEDTDAEKLMEMINDPEIENSVVGYSFPVSLTNQRKWISELKNDKTIRYAIDYKTTGFAGIISLSNLDFKNRSGNINIKLLKSARGQGIAEHSVKLLISYCFDELNLNCLYAGVLEKNEASKRLWLKLGFKIDGILRQRVYKNGEYHNLIEYSILKDEYDERNWQ